ncbi:hypothetical protein [Pleomorphovibrio marinus]|uniref:hypothetical protein n=1 Tax=Pleomorphovibrio marinus TaxID=2164132 RepID=UPI000E0C072B|nr:hypothetical protein [Pleomorphovibrio marinus]
MNKLRSLVWIMVVVMLMQACVLFRPRVPYFMGMSENRFLRQNRSAVISQLDGQRKVYRVNTDDRFYILATFENGELTNLEERELQLQPVWQDQRMMEGQKQQAPPRQ